MNNTYSVWEHLCEAVLAARVEFLLFVGPLVHGQLPAHLRVGSRVYRGTLWWSWEGGVSYERGTPVSYWRVGLGLLGFGV
jgi:hypothetical protein